MGPRDQIVCVEISFVEFVGSDSCWMWFYLVDTTEAGALLTSLMIRDRERTIEVDASRQTNKYTYIYHHITYNRHRCKQR